MFEFIIMQSLLYVFGTHFYALGFLLDFSVCSIMI